MDPEVQVLTPTSSTTSVSTSPYVTPVRVIRSDKDLQKFKTSSSYAYLLDFLRKTNDAIKGKTTSSPCHISPFVEKTLQIFETLATWVDEIPPVAQPMRYGNKAFRTWYERLVSNTSSMMLGLLPDDKRGAEIEMTEHFVGCFGNPTRIDYGTGHETALVMWFCVAEKLELISSVDYPAVVLKLFNRYLLLMRKIQRTYLLEPAGSHGVWSLDDYQFLAFLWGSGQLVGQDSLPPTSILSLDEVNTLAEDYLYFAAIQFIYKMKTGPFPEHSPILYDISAVPYWEKINGGFIKMYEVEVLGKFPIAQHFVFGSIFPLEV
eukprot:TRINITY_DN976_c0_g2_i1.p1 TRINITY_DN976_c0_g2~~TRINITY_DN976_c0_g2_i1.p1  ORF type:complete len:319 (+),score=63.76 TRINITY_DN976_c0_g2_i1:78-1034(+)